MRTLFVASKPSIFLAGLVLALLIANVAWLLVNRHSGAMDIDEAGYLRISLTDYEALRHGGISSLASTVVGQPTQAPLVPLLSSFAYSVLGRPTFIGAFAVQLLAYLIVIVATYSIASLLTNRWAGLVAAAAVASLPVMIDYTHSYSFAVPAAAAATVAIWAALRSDRMRLKRFTIVWGIAIGAMLITRTMTIAFLPGFALLAVLHIIGSSQRKRSLVGVGCGLVAAIVVAAPWYWAQGHSVWQYLTSFGYGGASAQYGAARSLFSLTSWLNSATNNISTFVWLPLAIVLFVGMVALAIGVIIALVQRRLPRPRSVIGSPWFYLAVVVAEGLLALQSTRNTGSAFLAPMLPAMFVLAVAGLWKIIPKRSRSGYMALGLATVLCLPSLIAATAFNTAAGQPIALDVPGLGSVKVIDWRDNYLEYASAEGELPFTDSSGTNWRHANDDLLHAIDEVVGAFGASPVLFAFDHSLVNPNTLGWEELMFHGTSPAIYLLTPPDKGPTGYSAQLGQMLGSGHGVVLICSDSRGMFAPILDQTAVRTATAQSGFRLGRSLSLPDGAAIEIWVR